MNLLEKDLHILALGFPTLEMISHLKTYSRLQQFTDAFSHIEELQASVSLQHSK